MQQWIQELCEEIMPCCFSIGDIKVHPSGRTVQIVRGQYWGTHGLSNFWYWQEVLEDGTLSSVIEHGYGWR